MDVSRILDGLFGSVKVSPEFATGCAENVRESVAKNQGAIVDAYTKAGGRRPSAGQELKAESASVRYGCFGGPWLDVNVGVYDPKQAAFVGAKTAVQVLR